MNINTRIIGLIVAAGYSSRMGVFKPLLPLGEKTVIETAVSSLRQGGVRDIRVVVGHQAAELRPILDRLNVVTITNDRYADGMYSSVVAGLKSFAGEADAFLLLPGDTPLIKRPSIKAVMREYRRTGAVVVHPVFDGQKGHPPLISAGCFPSILKGEYPGGLRDVLTKFASETVEVEVADQGMLLDMDTPEDYKILLKYYERQDVPTYEECLVMLRKNLVADKIKRHGRMVAEVGGRLASQLKQAGLMVNIDLVVAGGLVHDLAKGKPNHPRRGARLIRCQGFPDLANIVASHMDLEFAADSVVDEAAVVFLADKLVQGDRLVTLSERFSQPLNRFAGNAVIIDSVSRRLRTAETIRDSVANILGVSNFEEIT